MLTRIELFILFIVALAPGLMKDYRLVTSSEAILIIATAFTLSGMFHICAQHSLGKSSAIFTLSEDERSSSYGVTQAEIDWEQERILFEAPRNFCMRYG